MYVGKFGWLLCVAGVIAISGCGKKVGGQVVAVVNGQEITQGEVNAELNGQQIPPGADRKAVISQIVQRIVNRKLLVDKAKQQGLDKAPAYLGQVQRAQDAVLINMLATNVAKTLPVPDAAAADKFMTDNPSLFAGRKRYKLDQISFPLTTDPALQAKLKAAKTMQEIETALKAAGVAYQPGTGQLDTATIPPAGAAQIAALPPGSAFLVPQGGQLIASVITSSEAVPMSAQQARPAATELLRRQAIEQAMAKQVEQARSNAKITYSPDVAPAKNGNKAFTATPS